MHSKHLFDKRGKIPKYSIIGITSYFYVEKIVFNPQRGKMSFRGGIISVYTTCVLVGLYCIVHRKRLFNKRGKIPKNSISGITSYFYVEKIVFSPQRGKMSFTGGIFRIYDF